MSTKPGVTSSPVGVDLLVAGWEIRSDGDDVPHVHRQVTDESRGPRAVDDRAVANNQIGQCRPSLCDLGVPRRTPPAIVPGLTRGSNPLHSEKLPSAG